MDTTILIQTTFARFMFPPPRKFWPCGSCPGLLTSIWPRKCHWWTRLCGSSYISIPTCVPPDSSCLTMIWVSFLLAGWLSGCPPGHALLYAEWSYLQFLAVLWDSICSLTCCWWFLCFVAYNSNKFELISSFY